MENKNVTILDETKMVDSLESIVGKNDYQNNDFENQSKEITQEQIKQENKVNLSDDEYKKCIATGLERLANKTRLFYEKPDLSSFNNAINEIQQLEKLDKEKGFYSALKSVFLDAYCLVSNKERKYESKTLNELNQLNERIDLTIEKTKKNFESYNSYFHKLKSYLSDLDVEVSLNEEKYSEYKNKLNEQKLDLEKFILSIEKTQDEKEKEGINLIIEDYNNNLPLLESDVEFIKSDYETSKYNKDAYINKLLTANEILNGLKFNMKHLERQKKNIELSKKEKSMPDPTVTILQGKEGAYEVIQAYEKIEERDDEKRTKSNELLTSYPSIREMQKTHNEKRAKVKPPKNSY
jgi:hypothetical protein